MITHDKSVNQLFARPFLTVPYMGSGSGNPCFESMLNQVRIHSKGRRAIQKEKIQILSPW